MKTPSKKIGWMAVVAVAVVALMGAGCATEGHGHGAHGRMACCRCACKKMQEDPANPGKCKMCGHAAADHAPAGEGKPEAKGGAHH